MSWRDGPSNLERYLIDRPTPANGVESGSDLEPKGLNQLPKELQGRVREILVKTLSSFRRAGKAHPKNIPSISKANARKIIELYDQYHEYLEQANNEYSAHLKMLCRHAPDRNKGVFRRGSGEDSPSIESVMKERFGDEYNAHGASVMRSTTPGEIEWFYFPVGYDQTLAELEDWVELISESAHDALYTHLIHYFRW